MLSARISHRFFGALVMFLARCTPSSSPDVHYETNDGACVACRDGSLDSVSADVAPFDALDVGDAATARDSSSVGDGTSPNESGVPQGPCVPVGDPVKLAQEVRALGREVFVRADTDDFIATAFAQRDGLENIFIDRVDNTGTLESSTDATGASGAVIRGGSFAPEGNGNVVAFLSSASGALQVNVLRTDANDAPINSAIPVTIGTNSPEDPRIVAFSGGWMLVWRSRVDTTSAPLFAASMTTDHSVGTPVMITDAAASVRSFSLVADGNRVAVAYIRSDLATPEGSVVQLAANGSTMGPVLSLTTVTATGGTEATDIAAALRGDDLVCMVSVTPGTLVAQRVRLSDGSIAPPHALTSIGANLSLADIALDGTDGFAIAYRAPHASSEFVAMTRLDSTLTARESPSLISMVGAVSNPVHIAPGPANQYAIGWSFLLGGSTVANVRVMQCP